MTGLEALSLQGLPIDELLLTRETEDQLMDLAGNAMSTTVVGTAIISALVLGYTLMSPGDGEAEMKVAEEEDGVEGHIIGEDELTVRPLDLTSTTTEDAPISLAKLREMAAQSVRLCVCEGRTGVTNAVIKRCVACGATACARCAGRPEHDYQDVLFGQEERDEDEMEEVDEEKAIREPARLQPRDFERALKRVLPMCVHMHGIPDALSALGEAEDDEMGEDSDGEDSKAKMPLKEISDAAKRNIVRRALELAKSAELRFVMLKRQEIWVAIYESPTARLELHIYPHGPEWRLYGVPPTSMASGAPERKVLAQPLARCVVGDDAADFLDVKEWEVSVPEIQKFDVKIKGVGEKVPSWEARLGLQGRWREKEVWSKLKIEGEGLENIEGEYRLLDKCGTAAGSLHVREGGVEGEPPVYLFFDPSRGGEFAKDSFVVARTTRRLEFGETRPVLAKLSSSWRPKVADEETVKFSVEEKWVAAPLKIKVSLWFPVRNLHL